MQLYFIRHGQSKNNLLWDRTGSSSGRSHDPELTETGWKQAAALADYLNRPGRREEAGRDPKNINGFHLTHLYCSLMLRAVQTASVVARVTGLAATGWPDAHEEGGLYLEDEDTGELQGMAGLGRAAFQKDFPGLVLPDELTDAGWWNRPYESMEDRLKRVQRFLEELEKRHGGSDDRVAVVSHGGFYNLLINQLLHIPPDLHFWFSMSNTAITRIDFDPDETVVVYTNRTDFLKEELIS